MGSAHIRLSIVELMKTVGDEALQHIHRTWSDLLEGVHIYRYSVRIEHYMFQCDVI